MAVYLLLLAETNNLSHVCFRIERPQCVQFVAIIIIIIILLIEQTVAAIQNGYKQDLCAIAWLVLLFNDAFAAQNYNDRQIHVLIKA